MTPPLLIFSDNGLSIVEVGAFALDPFAFVFPAGLTLGMIAACRQEKGVELGIRHTAAEDRYKDFLHPPDDISAVSLVAELVIGLCSLLYFSIRVGLCEGDKVGIEEIDVELLLYGDRSCTVELLEEQLVFEFVVLLFYTPAQKVKFLEVITGIFPVKEVGGKIFRCAVSEIDGEDADGDMYG